MLRARFTSGWCSRCCSRRSTPSRGRASAALAGASSARRWRAGGKACRPLIARDGLGPRLHRAGAALSRASATSKVRVRTSAARAAISPAAGSRRSISATRQLALGDDDAVILAVPPMVAAALVPGLDDAAEFRAIVNAHFRIDPPAGLAADDRRRQRHHRMAVRVSPAGCRSRSAPPTGCSTCRARRWRRRSGRRCAAVTGLPDEAAALADRARAARDLRGDAGRECQAPGRARRDGAILFLAGDWTTTGLAGHDRRARSGPATARPIWSPHVIRSK